MFVLSSIDSWDQRLRDRPTETSEERYFCEEKTKKGWFWSWVQGGQKDVGDAHRINNVNKSPEPGSEADIQIYLFQMVFP